MSGYDELIRDSNNLAIADMAMKCEAVFREHDKALVSVSGGADSDVMMDLCERVRRVQDIQCDYVWFDTGIEYDATKRHLEYLEERYGVEIRRERADKTIAVCARQFGQPVFSKITSKNIEKLQALGFDWSDETYESMLKRYPNALGAVKWWTNGYLNSKGKPSRYSVDNRSGLRDYMLLHPPTFKVSAQCCTYAKKKVGTRVAEEGGYDLQLIGVRRAEGGARQKNGLTCYTGRDNAADVYRPMFWLTDADRAAYKRRFGIVNSDCYELWGFKRTGCVGCPFGKTVGREVAVVERWEPRMARAVRKIFGEAYEWQRRFESFRRTKRLIEKQARRAR